MRAKTYEIVKNIHDSVSSSSSKINSIGEYDNFLSPYSGSEDFTDEVKSYMSIMGESIYDVSLTRHDLLFKYVKSLQIVSDLKSKMLLESNLKYLNSNGIYEYDVVSNTDKLAIIQFYKEVVGTTKVSVGIPTNREQNICNYNFISCDINSGISTVMSDINLVACTMFNCDIGPLGYISGCGIHNSNISLRNTCILNGTTIKDSVISGSGAITLLDAIPGQVYTLFSGCTISPTLSFISLDGSSITVGE